MYWLADHADIQMHKYEIHALGNNQPADLVKELYKLAPGEKSYIRGYKSPHELQRRRSVRAYQRYWPHTKMIVGLRHPIKWFGTLLLH